MDSRTLQFRAESYRLLAACFYEPEPERFFKENLLDNLAQVIKPLSKEAENCCQRMIEQAGTGDIEELKIEHAKLFVGPFELPAPPYGSYYLDSGKRIMGDSTMMLIKMYRQYGLEIDDDFTEVPDHITAELEFMYYLIHKELEALRNSEPEIAETFASAQQKFMNYFLHQFTKPFCEEIKTFSDNIFYTALADCLLHFVANDCDFLENRESSKRGRIQCSAV